MDSQGILVIQTGLNPIKGEGRQLTLAKLQCGYGEAKSLFSQWKANNPHFTKVYAHWQENRERVSE